MSNKRVLFRFENRYNLFASVLHDVRPNLFNFIFRRNEHVIKYVHVLIYKYIFVYSNIYDQSLPIIHEAYLYVFNR